MNAVKVILIILAAIFGIWLVASALFPSHCHLERSIVINASPQTVFDQVNTLKNWTKWSYWEELDPNAKKTYEGPEAGKGSKYSWESSKTGKGNMIITESTAPESIRTELEIAGEGKALAEFKFEPVDGGTKVTWDFDKDVSFLKRVFVGLMLNKFLGEAYEKGLAKLKTVSESVPQAPALPVIEASVVELSAQYAITMRDTTDLQGIPTSLGMIFQTVMEYITSKKIETSGHPLAIWHAFDPATGYVEVEAGMPVTASAKAGPNMKLIKMDGKAVTTTYFGDYKKMSLTYDALREWMNKNNVIPTGAPWDVYITDPMVEKDTAKWQTEIYFPI